MLSVVRISGESECSDHACYKEYKRTFYVNSKYNIAQVKLCTLEV